MEWITNNWGLVLEYLSYVIAIATIIVKVTPNQTDNRYLEIFVKIFEVISGNTKPINSEKK